MRNGQKVVRMDDPGLCEGVCRSLRLAHSVGILHCDLRLSNVLRFGSHDFQLVDFGLSCTTDNKYNNPYDLQLGGSQASSVGPRLRQLLKEEEKPSVAWTVADDYEMLLCVMG